MTGDLVDTAKKIDDYSFTHGWLLNSLRENDPVYQKLHSTRPVKNIEAFDVSEGKGFMSAVYRCTVHFVDTPEVYTTILKIPSLKIWEKIQAEADYDMGYELTEEAKLDCAYQHQAECDFYRILGPLIQVPLPKIFKSEDWIIDKKDGCLHMEDLTLRGKTMSFFESVNLIQVKEVIRMLAKVHKNSLTIDEKLWKGKFVKNQLAFVDCVDMMEPAIEPFLKLSSKREAELRPFLEKYRSLACSRAFFCYVHQQGWQDLKLPAVLAQGDLHMGNIMWAIDSEGQIQNHLAAIIDWQCMHEGSPMEDLARFLINTADGITRRQAEIFAFKYYLECLREEFGGEASKVPYTAEELKLAYYQAFVSQTFILIACCDVFVKTLNETNQRVKDAKVDFAIQKVLHACQDSETILENDLKDLADKYNQ